MNVIENYNKIIKDISAQKLIVVTKTIEIERFLPLLQLGHHLFGENKVQEAMDKWLDLRKNYNIQLHLLGPLQSNKVKQAIETFDVIQSLAKEKTAKLLASYQTNLNKKLKYFIQVNTGGETQKNGIDPKNIYDFLHFCQSLSLDIEGLMCVPPIDEPAQIHFKLMEKLATKCGLNKLSMGMSNDYKIAITHNSNYIRIGRAIFGERI